MLSASFNYDNYAASDVFWMTTLRSCVRREPSGLLRQSPDWRYEEDDRQRVLNSAARIVSNTRKFERPGTHSFPAKSATLAGCCRPGSIQSLCPGVQMSAQDGS